jgi:hypothetical protein
VARVFLLVEGEWVFTRTFLDQRPKYCEKTKKNINQALTKVSTFPDQRPKYCEKTNKTVSSK